MSLQADANGLKAIIDLADRNKGQKGAPGPVSAQNGQGEGSCPAPLPTSELSPIEQRYLALKKADTDSLGEMYVGAFNEVARLVRAALPHRQDVQIIERIFAERLNARNAQELPHVDVEIKYELGAKPPPTKKMDVLWKLHDLKIDGIHDPRLDECVYVEDPEPEEKRRKCNLTKLKDVAKILGKPVQDIFEEGVIYATDADRPKTLVVRVKEHRLKAVQS